MAHIIITSEMLETIEKTIKDLSDKLESMLEKLAKIETLLDELESEK